MTESGGEQIGLSGAPSEREPISLLGESGRVVAENVARIALGSLAVADLHDPRYSLAPDGAVSIEIDGESFGAIQRIVDV